jgi:hypothetical protein
MMSMTMNVHRVTSIRLVDLSHKGRRWVRLVFTSTNYAGRESTLEIAAFPQLSSMALRVDQPEDEPEDDVEPEDDDEPVFMGGSDSLGHTDGERQDIRDAGRGHLLP